MRPTTAPTAPAPTGRPYDAVTAAVGPILAATGGDDGAAALATAARLAARAGGRVVVVSAVEPPTPPALGLNPIPSWIGDPEPYRELRRAQVTKEIADVVGDARWPIEVPLDEPSRAIAAAADAHRASLVVIGLGRPGVAARLLGDDRVMRTVRRARVPVLAVPTPPPALPARVAVAAVDFSASSLDAARAAVGLLADGGTLHLVHVWVRHPIDAPAFADANAAYERALPDRFERLEAALRDPARRISIVRASLAGDPVERVLEVARAEGADLVAAGRKGHGLLERLFVGRVTTGLLRAAECAVLVTPEPSGVERVMAERVLTGTADSRSPKDWPALLDSFTRRNAGRRTALEVDDPDLGAQAQESGYALLGATYDRHDAKVDLMLGDPASGTRHLTRIIDQVAAISILADRNGDDVALRVAHRGGQTLLTFLPTPP